ncbi:hypothetical protein SALBM217S_01793 [Streptomyces griseoloalbus]
MTASRPSTAAEELRGAGLRVTAARVALLDTVRQGGHLGVDTVAAEVRRRIGHVSLQAVYEGLNALSAAGLVRRIAPAGGAALYEGRVGDNHHHLVCRSCGAVADVDCADRRGALPDRVPATATASRSTRPKSSTGACAPDVPPPAVPELREAFLARKDSHDREP